MDKKRIFLILVVVIFFAQNIFPCTTGLADKEFSSSARALLWKNRDSSHKENELFYFNHGKVKFIAIINSNDTSQVWSGINNFGFAIMNSESRDLINKDTTETKYDNEGYLMKRALKTCKNIDDFIKMLEQSNQSGRKVTSNFGVIDASGRAAYFETGNHEFFKCEAKNNFLIRANFSMNGRGATKYGFLRYNRAKDWFQKMKQDDVLFPTKIVEKIISDPYLPPTITKENFIEYDKVKINSSIFRYSTVSSTIVEGVADNENPELSTFWCSLGPTATSVAIPIWVYSESIPACLEGEKESELNLVFRNIREYLAADEEKYILPSKYIEVRKEFDKLQRKVNRRTGKKLKIWRDNLPAREDVAKFQNDIADQVLKASKKLLLNLQK